MPIHLLPEDVASRIAAGEVVERPASVVKELVENSLDAGATRIEIETRAGGTRLIRVRDNGVGIPGAEAELAFRRHATSKLESAADLSRIATLGFRGEALASIASVSRTTCITRHREEEVGTRLRLEGGRTVEHTRVGRPAGTELVINDLFYNVPARRKFLSSERTERKHIDGFVTRYAIAYPGVSFYLVHDGREILSTPGNGAADEAIINVYGMDLGGSLLEIPPALTEGATITVRGFAGPTTVHRANRGYITLFVNGRWVQDLRLSYAIIQAYHTLLPTKRYPVAFVMVELPAEDVDVNVHPTKAEVRFRDADSVFRAVQRAVRATVVEQAPATAEWQPRAGSPSTTTGAERGRDTGSVQTRLRLSALRPTSGSTAQWQPPPTSERAPSQAPSAETAPGTPGTAEAEMGAAGVSGASAASSAPPTLPPLRVIGQVATMFIITEGPDGLYLVDQHAAHERILYEQMRAAWMTEQVPSQPLLEPAVVTLPADEAEQLAELLPTLHKLGLEVEPFGPGTFLVQTMPAHLESLSPASLLADVAAEADSMTGDAGAGRSPVQVELEEMIVRQICKRAAVKAGQVLAREEMERLIYDLEHTQNPRTCPHGRPTILRITTEELAYQFGRGG